MLQILLLVDFPPLGLFSFIDQIAFVALIPFELFC